MRQPVLVLVGATSVLLGACAQAPRSEASMAGSAGGEAPSATTGDPAGMGTAVQTGGMTSSAGSTDPGAAESSGDESGGDEPKFDLGPEGPGPLGSGCTKADFLFVIDNSSSMSDNQQNLIASFPGFIDAIEGTINAQDYHVMVVDSDESNGVVQCNGNTCGTVFPPPSCCPAPTSCNETIGSGRDVSGANGAACDFGADRQYISAQTSDFAAAFECAANVGTTGSANELPMTAMSRALSAEMNGAGGCNEGFLRDDAILVVTVVSDASPATANIEHGQSTAAEWTAAVIDAKGGNASAVVVLGLFENSPSYDAWALSFGDRGFLGSSALPDYGPLFLEAVSTIDVVCDEFEPEG
ncbi:MAG: hypothetical protein ACE37F_23850 [Nannocystaceae bacterium]|nr:hypothetical protein [bacterium]